MRSFGNLLFVLGILAVSVACGEDEQTRILPKPDAAQTPEDVEMPDSGVFTAGVDTEFSADSSELEDLGNNSDAGQSAVDSEQPANDSQVVDGGESNDVKKQPSTYCEPLGTRCVSAEIKQTCTVTGAFWADEFCPEGTGCQGGECLPQVCIPLLSTGLCAGTASYFLCNESGTDSSVAECDEGLTCFNGECVDYACQPGASVCMGNAAVQTCKEDGSGWTVTEVCQSGGQCVEATCHNACTVAASKKHASGCQFITTALPSQSGGHTTLVITVPPGSAPAQVTVQNAMTKEQLHPVAMVEDGVPVLVTLPPNLKIAKSHVGSAGVSVEATAPVYVRQFHPYDGKNEQAIEDGTLISPLHGLGKEYLAVSWFTQFPKVTSRHAYLTIVGAHPGVSEISVVPRGSIEPGEDGSGVGETTAGLTVNFSLKFGEVLQLRTKGDHGTDLTGSWVTASRPVAVFSGHECATVPNGIDSCSHLEEQLPPVSAWDSEVVVQRFAKRSDGDHGVVRVVAGAEGVVVTTQPKLAGFEKVVLNKGGFITLPATGSYVIQGSGPLMAGRFMIGGTHAKHGDECDGMGIGASAMTIATPTSQFVKEHHVVAPPLFKQSWLDVVAPEGATVLLNGTSISSEFKLIPETNWMTATVASSGGMQHLEATMPIAVTSYGYDCKGSYALPGNHRLAPLDVPKVDAVKTIKPPPVEEDKKSKPKSQLDTDNDGVLDDDDNCIFEPNVHQTDFDQDGFGDACDPDVDGDGALNSADCAPLDPALSPNNPEVCNGKDDNCDGEIDPADSVGCSAFWADMDGDGAGAKGFGVCLCEPSGDFQVLFGGDCDDGNPVIHPWAEEVCDNFDNDCNEAIDEGCDDDLDGWCDAELITPAFPKVCPNGGGDCNDYSKAISPAEDKVEIDNNGLDDDCDGLTDSEVQLTLEPDCPSVTCDDKSAQDLLCSIGACYGVSYTLSASVVSLTSGKTDQSVAGWLPMAQLGSPTNDLKPRDGKTYLVLSTGEVLDNTNDADLGGAKQKLKDPYVVGTQNMFDAIEVTLNVKAPPGVTGFQLEYVFLSSDYPENLGQKNTDKFYIIKKTQKDSEVTNVAGCAEPDKFSDYADDFGTWCYIDANSEFMESCDEPQTDITGTGYECNDKNDSTGGSSTGWLRSSWPVEPNEEFQIVLHLHDTKNALSDTTVVVDNFRWLLESFSQGTVKIKPTEGQ